MFEPLFAKITEDLVRNLTSKFESMSYDAAFNDFDDVLDKSEKEFVNLVLLQAKNNDSLVCTWVVVKKTLDQSLKKVTQLWIHETNQFNNTIGRKLKMMPYNSVQMSSLWIRHSVFSVISVYKNQGLFVWFKVRKKQEKQENEFMLSWVAYQSAIQVPYTTKHKTTNHLILDCMPGIKPVT